MGLPTGYTEVQYIQSTGTQYVDTEISVTPENASSLKSVIDKIILTTGTYALDGTGYGATPYFNSFYLGVDSNGNIAYGNGRTDQTTAIVYDKDRRIFTYDAANGVISVAGLASFDFVFALPAQSLNFYIFAYNQGSHGIKYYSGNLYSACIYQDGSLIRNYIPCINSDGEAGLYDTVNSKFYGNAGTGVFTAGPEVTWPSDDAIYVKVNGIWRQIDGIKLL